MSPSPESTDEPPEPEAHKLSAELLVAILMRQLPVVAVAFIMAYGLTAAGLEYGWVAFLIAPAVLGFMAVIIAAEGHRITYGRAAVISAVSVALLCLLFLILGFEGMICVAMALPLMVPLGIFGGLVAAGVCQQYEPPKSHQRGMSALALPLLIGALALEPHLLPQPPLREVTSSVVINANQQLVWDLVIAFPRIDAPPTGIFQTGIAYPIAARIEGEGVGAMRYCQFNTGDFVEPITQWEAPHTLAFDVTHNPIPMEEWSFYGPIDTPHLHGVFVSERGRFQLNALPNGQVELVGTTWYRQHIWPQWYWGAISDEIVHRIHLRVLEHIRQTAERG